MSKRIIYILILIIGTVSVLSGCGGVSKTYGEHKLKIVTTLFPQYDFSKEIAQDKADVSLLLPPGVEPHDFEPTPMDIVGISKADIFVYTGKYMEPWDVVSVTNRAPVCTTCATKVCRSKSRTARAWGLGDPCRGTVSEVQ